MNKLTPIIDSLILGIKTMASRKLYICAMIFVPIGCALFFLSLLAPGLPIDVPTGVVDMDHSSMSRSMIRSLDAEEVIEITDDYESYSQAMAAIRRGEIYGFYVIPVDFQADALSGRTPTISFFSNMTYYIPGTLSYKGLKTIAVSTAGAIVKTTLVSSGATDAQAGVTVQPMVVDTHPIGNPWTNYGYYLCPSFVSGAIMLMVLLMTIHSITIEIKHNTSRRWLSVAHGSMITALFGKLFPQTVVFSIVGIFIDVLFFKFNHFPLNGSHAALIFAMILLVVATQSFGVFIASVLPNPRLALSCAALLGILTFSIAGFSYPVESMYPAISIFAYILPVRYYFLIYINSALNGFDVFYARYYFAALLVFPFIAFTLLWRLKKACLNPVYVP